VTNKPDAAPENKEAVEAAAFYTLVGFLRGEGSTTSEHVNKANCNAPVDVQDQICLLLRRDLFNG
jgi:hypothetical protein